MAEPWGNADDTLTEFIEFLCAARVSAIEIHTRSLAPAALSLCTLGHTTWQSYMYVRHLDNVFAFSCWGRWAAIYRRCRDSWWYEWAIHSRDDERGVVWYGMWLTHIMCGCATPHQAKEGSAARRVDWVNFGMLLELPQIGSGGAVFGRTFTRCIVG